jgi:PIN domain nuclease of toxin-antitoxin system
VTRVLLDTHAFIWFIEGSPKLSAPARAAIEDVDAVRFLSVASVWEIAIKASIGRLALAAPLDELFPAQVERNAIQFLDIGVRHALRIATLPLQHRDPFGRMLAAQALVDDLTLISADTAFDAYAVRRVW